jgi:hypothetical protein
MTTDPDPEVLHIIELGLEDASFLCDDGVRLYRVGAVLLSLKGEHSVSPRVVFYREYDSPEIAKEALSFLQSGAGEETGSTDLEESISRESEWRSLVRALESA